MQLDISILAGTDIDSLYLYGVQNFGEKVAYEYTKGLFDCFDLIMQTPEMARKRSELKGFPRLIKYGSHMIFYRIERKHIKIIRVLHGRQNWKKYI